MQLAFEAIAPLWQTLKYHVFDSKLSPIPVIVQDPYPTNTDDHGIQIEIGKIPEGDMHSDSTDILVLS